VAPLLGFWLNPQWSRVLNVRDARLDSYTGVVMAGVGDSMWAAWKRSTIPNLYPHCPQVSTLRRVSLVESELVPVP
jgi:hypothetical protein